MGFSRIFLLLDLLFVVFDSRFEVVDDVLNGAASIGFCDFLQDGKLGFDSGVFGVVHNFWC